MVAERICRAGFKTLSQRLVVSHQRDDIGKGLDLCSIDPPSEAMQPATWRRIRRIRNDLSAGPINPVSETFKVGVDRQLSSASQKIADQRPLHSGRGVHDRLMSSRIRDGLSLARGFVDAAGTHEEMILLSSTLVVETPAITLSA
jgi:hypothetical protein